MSKRRGVRFKAREEDVMRLREELKEEGHIEG